MEYGVLVATFVAIMAMGLELGIAAGIVGASLLFAYNYSKVHCALCNCPCITCDAWQMLASARTGCRLTGSQGTTLCGQQHGILGLFPFAVKHLQPEGGLVKDATLVFACW